MPKKKKRNLSSGPLSPFILREIESLRGLPQTIDLRVRIRRLEKMAKRARDLELLGEEILAQAMSPKTRRRPSLRPAA